ncbi:M14 family zinc carboxypeptidase [Aestuariivivens sediminicola]|uniref:M14 family zinc carboxypeptidase n=1 Tax=Aestuariivivens sediminicola TaxID=2913560 RepID=UPI001F5A80B5|nr:M14 family zinc carboxypeptidase [Aestuariivivens sediminicola]
MELNTIAAFFESYKEQGLSHRYVTNSHIFPLLKRLEKDLQVETIGQSVLGAPIYALKIGDGKKRILMWSQMHGNESTTTKALFDVLNALLSDNDLLSSIRSSCSLYIIPILNPDGAERYTRVNANDIDLNRDAQLLTQPESKVLRDVFDTFKPDFCCNLHGQRTIFSAGAFNKPATISFLAPAQDAACSVTPNRKMAMEVIAAMNRVLQQVIPGQIGVYDDAFNLNCVGDTFQSEQVPTMLFEAGHFQGDYERENTRKYMFMALLSALLYISQHDVTGDNHEGYFEIPENQKLFFDIIIRNARIKADGDLLDIGIMYQEKLIDNEVRFIPKIEKMEGLSRYYAHKEYDANKHVVLSEDHKTLHLGDENVFVMIKNEKIALKLK